MWLNGTFSWAVDDGRITTQSLSRLRSVAGAHAWAVKQLSGNTILRLKEGQQEDHKTGCPTQFNETGSIQQCFTDHVVINMKISAEREKTREEKEQENKRTRRKREKGEERQKVEKKSARTCDSMGTCFLEPLRSARQLSRSWSVAGAHV